MSALAGILNQQGAGTVITETFNKADGALGPDLSWTVINGTTAVVSNRAQTTTANSPSMAVTADDLGSANNYAEGDVTVAAAGGSNINAVSAMCRMPGTSANTGYGCMLLCVGSLFYTRIERVVAGAVTVISGPTAFGSGSARVRIEANGSTINGYVNGALVHSVTDTTITTGNYAGMRHYRYAAAAAGADQLDNFEAGTL